MMTSEQCRAARAWLNWTQQELARRAHVGLSTVKEFEKGERRTIAATADAMQRALADAGIEFLDEGGEAVGIRRKRTADREEARLRSGAGVAAPGPDKAI